MSGPSVYGPSVFGPSQHGDRGQLDGLAGEPIDLRHPAAPTAPHGSRSHFVDHLGQGPAYAPSRDLQHLLQAIPASAGIRFSNEHLAALDVAIERTRLRQGRHSLDFRVSLPVLGKRYYLVLLGGKERRSRARLRSDGQDAARRLWIGYALVVSVLFSASVVFGIMLLYLVKSMLGIDVFDEHSVMHDLFFR